VSGGLVVLGSFMLDFATVLNHIEPPPFHWGIFATGFGLAVTGLVLSLSRLQPDSAGSGLRDARGSARV
jgi:hypothetical protein